MKTDTCQDNYPGKNADYEDWSDFIDSLKKGDIDYNNIELMKQIKKGVKSNIHKKDAVYMKRVIEQNINFMRSYAAPNFYFQNIIDPIIKKNINNYKDFNDKIQGKAAKEEIPKFNRKDTLTERLVIEPKKKKDYLDMEKFALENNTSRKLTGAYLCLLPLVLEAMSGKEFLSFINTENNNRVNRDEFYNIMLEQKESEVINKIVNFYVNHPDLIPFYETRFKISPFSKPKLM